MLRYFFSKICVPHLLGAMFSSVRLGKKLPLLFLRLQVPVVAAEVAQQYEAVVTVLVVDWVVT